MATRFYLSNASAPLPGLTPGFESSWENTANALRRTMDTTQRGSPMGSVTYNIIPATVPLDALHRQFISSNPMDSSGTLSGTFSLVLRTAQTATTSDAFVQVVIKILQSDGTTVRGVAYSGHADTTVVATAGAQNQEMPTAAATRIANGISLTSQAYQPGDRIVVELGTRYVTTSGSNQGVALNHGDPGDGTADFALTSGLTTTLVSWLEFSQTLTFDTSSTATRFYLSGSGSPAVTPAAVDSLWDSTTGMSVWPCSTTKRNTAFTAPAVSEGVTTNAWDILNVQFVSDDTFPAAVTVGTGTMSVVVRNTETSTNANFFMQVVAKVVSGDGSTVRGVLFAGDSSTAAGGTAGQVTQEVAGGAAVTRVYNAQALSSVSAQAGDRVVIEIGGRACNTSATSFSLTQRFGDLTATQDFGLIVDSSTDLCPWVEFSEDFFSTIGGAATLDGSGTLSTTAAPAPTGTVTLTGSGTLATTRVVAVPGTATLSGSGALTGLGAPGPVVVSALSGSGTLGAVGSIAADYPGTATLSGSGALTPVQVPRPTQVATLTGSGTLSAVGVPAEPIAETVSLSGSGVLNATGVAVEQVPVTVFGEPFVVQAVIPTGYAGDAAVVIPDTGPDPDPTDLDPAAPSMASGMSRWMFTDPETSETYVFHINPNEMSTVHRELGLRTGVRSATVPLQSLRNAGVVRVLREKRKPLEWTFGGILRTRDQYMQLRKWSHKNRRILVTDHFDRTWSVVVSGVKYEERRPTSQALWRFKYTVTCTLYGRVS